MQQYVDSLKDIYKDKGSLYKETRWRHQNNNNGDNFTDVHIQLIDLGYDFTRSDFDNFVSCLTHGKKKAVVSSRYGYDGGFIAKITRISKVLFTKYTPTDKQLKALFACYNTNCQQQSYEWIDTLIQKGYVFSDFHKPIISSIGYDVTKLLNGNISYDDLLKAIKAVINNSTHIDSFKKVLNLFTDTIPENILNYVLETAKNDMSASNWYYNIQEPILFKILDLLIERGGKFDNETNTVLINNNCNRILIYQGLFKRGFIPNEELIKYLFLNPATMIEIILYLKKFEYKFTTANMNNILNSIYYFVGPSSNGPYGLTTNSNQIMNYLIGIGYNDKIIGAAMETPNGQTNVCINLYKFMIELGVKPDISTLNIACTRAYYQIFDEGTTKYKFVPTKEILDNCLAKGQTSEMISKILCYKIVPDSKSFTAWLHSPSREIFELLVKFGLTITFNDLVNALNTQINIENLERFGIEHDENLYYHCYMNNFFPQEYLKKFTIDKNILELRNMCRVNTTTKEKLIEYIKENNVILDRYCYDHACAKNRSLVNYFDDELKCEPTLGSFYWLTCDSGNKNKFFNFAKIYKIDIDYLTKNLILKYK